MGTAVSRPIVQVGRSSCMRLEARGVERHDHDVVDHLVGLDDCCDALFELLGVAVVFELDHDADAARLRGVEHFAERGESHGAELGVERAADVDGPQVRGGRVVDIER